MPWLVRDVVSQRIQFVSRALSGREKLGCLCKEFGISRPTGYLWLRRYEKSGSFTQLKERSRKPLLSPRRTSEQVERRVVELRDQYGWGGRKIQYVLKRDEQIGMAVRTVNRILKRRGKISEQDSHRPARERFQRDRPNELWQMDFKGQYAMVRGECYPLSILDDHSRYAVGLYALQSTSLPGVQRCLIETLQRYGVPEAMLMDHGTPWWSTTNGHGLTRLTVDLIKQGIRLCYSAVRHPQTQGKVERFHRTLGKAVRHHGEPTSLRHWSELFEQIRHDYNQVRPHEALDMQVPAQRYRPSTRAYSPKPREWQYEEGSQVRRLSQHGCLALAGRYFFVCEALAHERVCLTAVDDKILVQYRHMYIREIDLRRASTVALIEPVRKSTDLQPVCDQDRRLQAI